MTPQDWATAVEFAKVVVDLIKALAWPAAAMVIAWRALPALLQVLRDRTVDVQGFGLKATIRATEQQQTDAAEIPVNRPALAPPPAAAAVVVRPAVQLVEQAIRAELPMYPDREGALISALASARVQGQHEWAYNRIFGSQITTIKMLDDFGGATVGQVQAGFEPFTRMYPDLYQAYGFDGWLNFMISAGLVARDGDRLTATPYGHDFLIYLRESRLTEAKAG